MATRPRDLYAVLEVDRKASQDDIKKAYRRLARKYHPDANPGDASAEERFKEVSQAYDVLGDAEKRRKYDRAGVGGFAGGARTGGAGAPGGFDVGGIGDIISDLFGNAARRGGGGGGSTTGAPPRKPRQERGRDVETEVSLSFAQAMEGGQVTVSVPLAAACDTCRGSGAKPGTSPRSCPQCRGRGVEAQGQGLFSISQPCSRCGGRGVVVDDPCPTCSGSGINRTVKTYRVNVPAGVKEGSRVRVAGKGEAGRNGGLPGDLYVITRVSPSPIFARKGDNLEVEVPLTIPEAIRGAEVEVPTLHGGRKRVRVPAGTSHGTVQRLRGEGPPRLNDNGTRGDLHVRFVIDVPATLSAEQRRAVDSLARATDNDPRERLFAAAAQTGEEG
ncbi:MAG TPA: molecular chaperone DnaJ [Solirubrobacteraceae bacterium]|nr:molecular chaperone DnaJ [Solirubrobacteraceae bacterium]